MSLKIRKGIPLIDQHDKNGMWGGKFGGNFVPETLKKPIEDLEKLFSSPFPKPYSIIKIKIPIATVKPERKVRSLFFLIVSKISCQVS